MAANQTPPDLSEYHQVMVDKLKVIQSPPVEIAFRAVPRHLFLPDVPPEQVYRDAAIPTKFEKGKAISSSSQPSMMALMLEQLALQPGHRVLEIGAGTGYNAALMAHLVGTTGQVTTVDIDEDIAAAARAHLDAAGFEAVHVICGDGVQGYLPHAPYDRIILTVGGWDICPAWLAQLKPDGRLLLPLSINGPQLSIAFDQVDGHLVSQSMTGCGFMRVRGDAAEPNFTLALTDSSDLTLESIHPLPETAAALYDWLTAPAQDWPTHIEATVSQLWRDLMLWLALQEPRFCILSAHGDIVDQDIVPFLFGTDGTTKSRLAAGIWGQEGLAMLARTVESFEDLEIQPPKFTVFVRGFGPNQQIAHHLVQQVQTWEQIGRPGIDGLQLRVYPLDQPYTPQPHEVVVTKRWQRFVLAWS